ncbi:MAG: UPF0149 family protein [Chlorobium sp.]
MAEYFSEDQFTPITASELHELEEFLLSDAVLHGTMPLDMLDGFLTALHIGPVTTPPAIWVPFFWDMTGGGKMPRFKSDRERVHIMELFAKMVTSAIYRVFGDSDDVVLLPDRADCESEKVKDGLIKYWATGFMMGVNFNSPDWLPIFSNNSASMMLLAIDRLCDKPDEPVPLPAKMCREFWTMVPGCVKVIKEFWMPYRLQKMAKGKGIALASAIARIGRNDPCLCGSGKKFKKCCGR